MNPIIDLIRGLFKPAAELIDDLTTTKEEKMKAEAVMMQLETSVLANLIQYQQSLDEARAKVIMAEAQSDSWLASNWRPLIMVMFGFIVLNNHVLSTYFGLPKLDVPPDLWTLMKIGLGGYVVGRSFEKVVKNRNGKE
jgi:hypothetical protein